MTMFPCPKCGNPVEWTMKMSTGHLLDNDVKIMPCGHVMTEQEIVNGQIVHRDQIQEAEIQRHHMPERADREGDSQPLPTVNDHPDIQSQVIADIEARREVGIKRYGTALQPHNGREALVDAYEEALDLAMYLKQRIVEGEDLCGDDERMVYLATYCSELERVIRAFDPRGANRIIDGVVDQANRRVMEQANRRVTAEART